MPGSAPWFTAIAREGSRRRRRKAMKLTLDSVEATCEHLQPLRTTPRRERAGLPEQRQTSRDVCGSNQDPFRCPGEGSAATTPPSTTRTRGAAPTVALSAADRKWSPARISIRRRHTKSRAHRRSEGCTASRKKIRAGAGRRQASKPTKRPCAGQDHDCRTVDDAAAA